MLGLLEEREQLRARPLEGILVARVERAHPKAPDQEEDGLHEEVAPDRQGDADGSRPGEDARQREAAQAQRRLHDEGAQPGALVEREAAEARDQQCHSHRDLDQVEISDARVFTGAEGLTWSDSAERVHTRSLEELANWLGERAHAGRLAPQGFPKNNRFGPVGL